jgi:hypothetical protein
MKKEKRGDVELMIDSAIRREGSFSDNIRWVQQEIPVSSLNDLAIGYTIGVIETFAI